MTTQAIQSAMRAGGENAVKRLLRDTLRKTGGNVTNAAFELGLSHRHMCRWMATLKLSEFAANLRAKAASKAVK